MMVGLARGQTQGMDRITEHKESSTNNLNNGKIGQLRYTICLFLLRKTYLCESEMPEDQRRDTACPKTLIKIETRMTKLPDVIGIGFPKCGTGTLAFLDCHSKIVFREAEGMLWHN